LLYIFISSPIDLLPNDDRILTCVFSVFIHFKIFKVEPAGAVSGTTHVFSQQGTGCINCRRAASVVAALTPILRRVAMSRFELVLT